MGLKEVFRVDDLGNNEIGVHTPYNPAFISEMKKLPGSTWNSKTRNWEISNLFIDAVRRTMRNIYGHDDLVDDGGSTIKIRCNTDVYSTTDTVVILGHTVAYAISRGGRTFPGEGVKYLSGGCTNILIPETQSWITKVVAGSILEISNVSDGMLEHDRELLKNANIEILPEMNAVQRRDALIAEKNTLLNRIKEIDAELDEIF